MSVINMRFFVMFEHIEKKGDSIAIGSHKVSGLTRKDIFAMAALQGLISAGYGAGVDFVEIAYNYAEKMESERKRR